MKLLRNISLVHSSFDKVMSFSSQNIATCKLKNQLPDVIPRSLVAGVRGTLSLVAKAPASMNRVVDDGEKYWCSRKTTTTVTAEAFNYVVNQIFCCAKECNECHEAQQHDSNQTTQLSSVVRTCRLWSAKCLTVMKHALRELHKARFTRNCFHRISYIWKNIYIWDKVLKSERSKPFIIYKIYLVHSWILRIICE